MKVSKQAKRDAKGLLRSCLVNGVLDDQRAREVVGKVAAAKPRGYLGMLVHFQRLLRLELIRRTARVESAVPLTFDLQADVTKRLSCIYGPGLQLVFSQNPALLAGLRVQVGSDVFDGSVQARLNALAESL